MNRREFLVTGAAAAAGVVMSDSIATAEPSPAVSGTAEQKLCSQVWLVPGKELKEKIDNLSKWGAAGIEMHAGFNPDELLKACEGTPIKPAAICAADGPYITSDKAQQRKAVENAKQILDRAGHAGCTGVIMVPAFNGAAGELEGREAHKVLIGLLQELGEHAVKAKSRMLLEPLNRKECWFLRQCAYAASICQEVNSPGVQMMGDMYHMNFEEPSDQAGFISGGPWLHHVHLASTKRNLPGQDERSFVDGFRGLKRVGFKEYMSLECGILGKPEEEMPKSFKFLKQQWEEATI